MMITKSISLLVICCIIATNSATISLPVITPFLIESPDYTPNTLYQFYVPINAKKVEIEIDNKEFCIGERHLDIVVSTQDGGISSDYYNKASFSNSGTTTLISLDPTYTSERQMLRWTVGSFWRLAKASGTSHCRSYITRIDIEECPVGTIATPLINGTNTPQVVCKPAQSLMLPISDLQVVSTSAFYAYFDDATTSSLIVQVKAATNDLVISGSKQGLSLYKDCKSVLPVNMFTSYTYTMECSSIPHGYWFMDITSPSGVINATIDVYLRQCPTGRAGPGCNDLIYQMDATSNLTVTTESAGITYFAFNVDTIDGTHSYSRFQFQVQVSKGPLTVLTADRLPSQWTDNLNCFDGECIDHTTTDRIPFIYHCAALQAKTIFFAVKTTDATSISVSQRSYGDYPIFQPKILNGVFVNEKVGSLLNTYRVPMPSNARSFNVSILPLTAACPIRLLFREDNAPCSTKDNGDRLCSLLTWRSLPVTDHFTFDASMLARPVFPPNRFFYLAVEKDGDDDNVCQYSISAPHFTFCNASQLFVNRDGFQECVDSYSIQINGDRYYRQGATINIAQASSVVAISVGEGAWRSPTRMAVNLTTEHRVTDVQVVAAGIGEFMSCGLDGTQTESMGSQWSYNTVCPFPTGQWSLLVSLEGEGQVTASLSSNASCDRGYDCLSSSSLYDTGRYLENGIIRSPTNSSGRIHRMNPYTGTPASWQIIPMGSTADIQTYIQGYGYPNVGSTALSPGQIVVMSNQDFISYASWNLLVISSVPYMVVAIPDSGIVTAPPSTSVIMSRAGEYWGGYDNVINSNINWVEDVMFEPVTINQGITLPFDFSFGSQSYKTIYINSQCLIAFEPFTISRLLPQPPWTGVAAYPQQLIAPWWGDLDLTKGGKVQVLPGTDTFVIQFMEVPSRSDANTLSTFQVILYASSDNRVQFTYKQLDSGMTNHVLGVRDADGYAMSFMGQIPFASTNNIIFGKYYVKPVSSPVPFPTYPPYNYSPYTSTPPPQDQSIPTSKLLMQILIPVGICFAVSSVFVVILSIYLYKKKERQTMIAGIQNITQDLEARPHVIDISNGVAGASPKNSPKMNRTPNTPRKRRQR